MSKISSGERGRLWEDLRTKTAGEVMNTNIVTVRDDAPIDEAIRLMLARAIKRLPVVDAAGKYQGMVSREALFAPDSPPHQDENATFIKLGSRTMTSVADWFAWALLSAVFAALTAIFAKIGLEGVDSDLATLIRTVVILMVLTGFVYFTGKYRNPFELHAKTWLFLVLSGLATGASWVCYFRALKIGDASKVAPVDKLSLLLVALFAVLFLGERPVAREWLGILLIGVGVIILALKR